MTVSVLQEDPFMNGEYGYEFTKGFQEGDEEQPETAGAGGAAGGNAGAEQLERPGFGQSYWKASGRAA